MTQPVIWQRGVATLLIVGLWTKLFPELLNVQSLQKETR